MENNEQERAARRENWEVTLLIIGVLLAIVLALVGWYMDGNGAFPG